MKDQVKNSLEEQENYTSKYKCEKCKDVTYILVGDKAYPCSCKAIRDAERILAKSGISKEFAKKTFKNFDYSRDVQILNAYTIAREYVKNFAEIKDNRNNSLIFMGSVGSGKSHLSFAVANELIKNGVAVIYMGYRDAIIKLKQKIMDSDEYDKLMNTYKNSKVLLVDDLFKGNITPSDLNIFFEIVNHRYFNNLPMIISTEMLMDELLKVDEAIGSRLLEMCGEYSVELKGSKLNYRIYK